MKLKELMNWKERPRWYKYGVISFLIGSLFFIIVFLNMNPPNIPTGIIIGIISGFFVGSLGSFIGLIFDRIKKGVPTDTYWFKMGYNFFKISIIINLLVIMLFLLSFIVSIPEILGEGPIMYLIAPLVLIFSPGLIPLAMGGLGYSIIGNIIGILISFLFSLLFAFLNGAIFGWIIILIKWIYNRFKSNN